MLHNCDCDGKPDHEHVEDITVESVMVLPDKDALEGPELTQSERLAIDAELDDLITDQAYSDSEPTIEPFLPAELAA
jgi:hypothetical protein